MNYGSRVAGSLADDFRFDVAPHVVDWLEGNLVLPRTMSPAMPGPYSTRRQPTSRPILECFHPASGVRTLTNVAGAQTAKTTEGIMGTAYRIVHDPMPMLILGPSEDWLRLEISEKRLMALIDANHILSRMKPPDKSRYRKLAMEMIGGTIAIEGANSPVATAGSTQGIVWIEEAAKIEHQSREDTPEAHPIKLAFERTKAFKGLELHYLSFTPNRSTHIAWQTYEAGSQTHFPVPCPHCGEWFPFEFELRRQDEEDDLEAALNDSQLEAKPDVYRSLIWSPSARDDRTGFWNEDKVRETAIYVCPHNGCEIEERHRTKMIADFETEDRNPEAPKGAKSFRRPSFYGPSITFGDMANEFLKRGDLYTTGLQNFYNSWLAKPWEKMDRNVKEEHVMACRAEGDLSYLKGVIPDVEGMLAIAGDPGERRTHWVAGVITREEEIWVVDWGTVLGVDDLIPLLGEAKWREKNYPEKGLFGPQIGLVDSGDNTKNVYKMCRRSRGFWWPYKGSDATFGTWSKKPINTEPGLYLYTGIDYELKNELYDRRIYQKRSPRLWLPSNAGPEIISQLSGQQRITENGKKRWKKIPNDHYGDCVKQLVFQSWVLRSRGGEA